MSDGLNRIDVTGIDRPSSSTRVVVLQVAIVLVLFVAAGAVCGVLWWWAWSPPRGDVVNGGWYPDERGLRGQFRGTGWYAVVALVAGLVLGAVCALLLARSELATLAAVLVGAVLAGLLMREVGQHLGPPDPSVLARTTTRSSLPGDLRVSGWPPLVAFPFASMLALCVVYLLTGGRTPAVQRSDEPGVETRNRG